MMPEKKRSPYQVCSGKEDNSQIKEHQLDKSADELLEELEAKIDEMTEESYDDKLIDAYLTALDEKAPIDESLNFDVDQSWEKFRSQHAIIFREEDEYRPTGHARRFSFRKATARFIVVAAIVVVFSIFCVQAAGIDVLGAIGQWTEDLFRFTDISEEPGHDSGSNPNSDNSLSGVMHYPTLQDALDANSIASNLVPSWIPDRYELGNVEVTNLANQTIFDTYSTSKSNSTLGITYTYWASDGFTPSVIEKDVSDVTEYVQGGITHYIMSNEDVRVVTWINGRCECTIWGNLSLDETEKIIDSIYA